MTETFEERIIRYRERTLKDGWKGEGSIAVSTDILTELKHRWFSRKDYSFRAH
jgi:hypothetical protein